MVRGEAGRRPICPNLFGPFSLNRNPAKIFLRGKRKRKSELFLLVFRQTDGFGPERCLEQTRQAQLHETQQKKRLNTDETQSATQTLLNLM